MPRPKNNILFEIFKKNHKKQAICNQGKCNGKILCLHSANLERHLRIIHNDLYKTYIVRKNAILEELKASTENLPKKNIELRTKMANGMHKNNAKMAFVELFTKCGRPLEMLEDQAFKILLQPLFVTLNISGNSQNLNDMIIEFSRKLCAEISADVEGKLISIKIDAVTKNNLSVMGVNVVYVKNKCMTVKTLAVREFRDSYTSEYIISIILEVLEEYSIDMNQILTISTDNGDNILNAVNILNSQLRKNLLPEQTLKMNSIEESLETSVACSGHILQLCAHSVLNAPGIKYKLEECRIIARKLRTRKYLNLFKCRGYREALLDRPSSWISTYNMIARLLEIRVVIESFSVGNSKFALSTEIWCFMKEFIDTFKPVELASKKLQSEELCFSELYVIIMELLFQIEKLSPNGMTELLISELKRKKVQLFENELFNAAIYLDPRIRICMDSKQIQRAKKYITSLHERINSLQDMNYESITNSPQSDVEYKVKLPISNQVTHESFSDYLQSLDPEPKTNTKSSVLTSLAMDFGMYERLSRIPLNSSIKNFWNSQSSALSVIADIILVLPATYNTVERLFSALKNIPCKQPNKIIKYNLEHLLLVKINGVFNYEEQFYYNQYTDPHLSNRGFKINEAR